MKVPVKRALLSVSDKTGIVAFAQKLRSLSIEIISTGGTSDLLQQEKIAHLRIEEITQFPEIFKGRVKSLHPLIHGGILGKRDHDLHEQEKMNIQWIDLVVVNFYPFMSQVTSETSLEKAIEYIDIGGPTMVRGAAKNFAWVGVVTDPKDYDVVIDELSQNQSLNPKTRLYLAHKAFALTSRYELAILKFFNAKENISTLTLQLEEVATLRYGENPHQMAKAYRLESNTGILSAQQHQGKALSYNNILDADAALNCLVEFDDPTVVIVKHGNPCGVASDNDIMMAYHKAHESDPLSAFGGIVAINRPVTRNLAECLASTFIEVVIAFSYSPDALSILAKKPNLRVLSLAKCEGTLHEMKFINGGVLYQDKDNQRLTVNDLQVVTTLKPNPDVLETICFSWQVIKHIKSNAILIAKKSQTVGIGGGLVSRIDAVDLAIRKAGDRLEGSVLASDAFFPFRDSIDRIAKTGIKTIVQPGGSVRDEEVISACNEHGLAMVFTGKRCFKH